MSDKHITFVQPEHFAPPRGYANGVVSTGRILHIAGQIGWDSDGTFSTFDLIEQFAKTLDNIIAVVEAAGGTAAHVVKMTIYVTDMDAYRTRARELGPIWRERFGTHYPAMALVRVVELVEPNALVEIEAVASLPTE